MKKIITAFILILTLLLCSCVNPDTTASVDNVYNQKTDMQYYYREGSEILPVTNAPDGYYYVGEDGIIIYIDKESMKSTPLCNKVNCKHNDSKLCNAYQIDTDMLDFFGDESLNTVIQYYDGYIYTLGFEYNSEKEITLPYLKRLNLDGTNSTRITNVLNVYIQEWMLHRGYFYYALDTGLYRIPLNSPKTESETVYKINGEEDSNNINKLLAYGDYLYFKAREYDLKTEVTQSKTYCIDLDTMKPKELKYNDETYAITSFYNGKIILQKGISETEVGYFTADLDISNVQNLITKEFYHNISTDGIYMYYDNRVSSSISSEKKQQEIIVYDFKGKEIDSFTLPVCVTAGQDEKCFLVSIEDGKEGDYLYYIDKSEIGTFDGKSANLKKICKLEWSKTDS